MKKIFFCLSVLSIFHFMLRSQPVLYGVTRGVGNGSISKFVAGSNTLTAVYTFEENGGLVGSSLELVEASNGKLFGTVSESGKYASGLIYSIDPVSGEYKKVKDLNSATDGFNPNVMINGPDGKLYGLTNKRNGSLVTGVIFRFDPVTFEYQNLKELNPGERVVGRLLLASDGNMYGVTGFGGVNNLGVIFRFNPANSTYSKLYDLTSSDGRVTDGHLAEYPDGKLYGMTSSGGLNNTGIIFSLDIISSGFQKLHDFDDLQILAPMGARPSKSLTLAADGKLYGVTVNGGLNGKGVIFSYDPVDFVYAKVFDFDGINGANPRGDLAFAADGKFYGTTSSGGGGSRLPNGDGVIFSFDPSGRIYQKLLDLNSVNTLFPSSPVYGSDGKFYIRTSSGGAYTLGNAFSFDPVIHVHNNLHDFGNPDGIFPAGTVTKADDGKLYGMTTQGGIYNRGVIYSFDPATSVYTKHKDLSCTSGCIPGCSLLKAQDGKLYGMAKNGLYNKGVIFSFDPASSHYTQLMDFDGFTGFLTSSNSLIEASDGKLYGMTNSGGSFSSGVIFSYDLNTANYTKLKDLEYATGSGPQGDLVEGDDGKLYGLTQQGGTNGAGVLFSFDPETLEYEVLQNLELTCVPTASLMKANNGRLFGMGVKDFFSYDPATSTFAILSVNTNVGTNFYGNFFQASDGKLYAMGSLSEPNVAGTVFSLDLSDNSFTKLQEFNYVNGYRPSSGCQFVEVPCDLPVVTYCPVTPVQCLNESGIYSIPALTATGNCSELSISYSISGTTTRSGSGDNASGEFNPGTSTINWIVTDEYGNSATCSTSVVIDKVDASIPDVYASGISPAIGNANTIYTGYGGSSVTLNAESSSSFSPNSFSYKWTIGSHSGTVIGTGPSVTVSPTVSTIYYLSIKDINNCKPIYNVTKQINVTDIRCGNDKIYVCQFKNGVYSTKCIQSTPNNINDLPAGAYLGQCNSPLVRTTQDNIPEERVQESMFSVYPNPSNSAFTLVVNTMDQQTPVQIKVINANGQVIEVKNKIPSGQIFKIGENYQPGVYWVDIIKGVERKSIKLIKLPN